MLSDAGLRRGEAAAQVWDDAARWDDGSGRLCLGRWKTDAEARTVYLTPAAVAALEAMRPAGADGSAALFGLSAPWISRRIRAAAAAAGLGSAFPAIRDGWAWRGAEPQESGEDGGDLYARGGGGAGREVAGVGASLRSWIARQRR